MTDARPGGRFERHPRLTGLALLAGALLMAELGLRLAAPGLLVFAHTMRRVHGYSRTARVDLRPSQSVRLRLDRGGGRAIFDFSLRTGPLAFRIERDEPATTPSGSRVLHAIGDSYTMGWGVDAASSYPACLARRLGPGWQVLNLGVDGFGAIGATGKSRALAGRFPPALAVYLFSPNDLDDDARAEAVARRSGIAHAAYEALDGVRRASYLAAVPFALRYRLQFGAGGGTAGGTGNGRGGGAGTTGTGTETGVEAGRGIGTGTGTRTKTTGLDPRELLLPIPAALSAPPVGHPTLTALLSYRSFLAARGARLLVLVLSNQPESLAAYRFCREQGIEAHLFDVPQTMRIPGEGHFNVEGNEAVAELVEHLLREAAAEAGK